MRLFPQYTSWDNQKDLERPLVIGYVSPDFFTHSVSYFIEAPLVYHNYEKYKVVVYSAVVKVLSSDVQPYYWCCTVCQTVAIVSISYIYFLISSLCVFYTFDCLDFKKVNCFTHGTISSSFLWEPIRLPKIYGLILGKTEVPLLASPMIIPLMFIVWSWLMLLLPLELPVFAVNTFACGYYCLCF